MTERIQYACFEANCTHCGAEAKCVFVTTTNYLHAKNGDAPICFRCLALMSVTLSQHPARCVELYDDEITKLCRRRP